MPRSLTPWLRRSVLATTCVLAACPSPRPSAGVPHDTVGAGPAPTPAPPFASIDGATHSEVLRYARSLTFDGRTGVTDSQALAVALPNRPDAKCPADCTYGPVASIHPEVGAVALGDAELKAGRIVARIINADAAPYEKFHLGGRDTVYVWVDVAASPRARLISSDPERFEKQSRRDVRMTPEGPHPDAQRYLQSAARFLWSTEDEHIWITCQPNVCCKVEP